MRASNESRKQSSRKSRGERVQGQGQQQEDKSARAIGATKHNDRPRFRLNFSSRSSQPFFLFFCAGSRKRSSNTTQVRQPASMRRSRRAQRQRLQRKEVHEEEKRDPISVSLQTETRHDKSNKQRNDSRLSSRQERRLQRLPLPNRRPTPSAKKELRRRCFQTRATRHRQPEARRGRKKQEKTKTSAKLALQKIR